MSQVFKPDIEDLSKRTGQWLDNLKCCINAEIVTNLKCTPPDRVHLCSIPLLALLENDRNAIINAEIENGDLGCMIVKEGGGEENIIPVEFEWLDKTLHIYLARI
jgi:hypothetical protein